MVREKLWRYLDRVRIAGRRFNSQRWARRRSFWRTARCGRCDKHVLLQNQAVFAVACTWAAVPRTTEIASANVVTIRLEASSTGSASVSFCAAAVQNPTTMGKFG